MRLLSLLFAFLLASPALAVDSHPGRNRSSGGKSCLTVNVSGTLTDALCAEGTGDVTVERPVADGTAAAINVSNSIGGSEVSIRAGSSNTSPQIGTTSADDLVLFANGVEKFRIRSSGDYVKMVAGNNPLMFYTTNTGGSAVSCTTQCGTEPSGANATSGTCLAAWNSSGNVSACSTATTSQICMCVAIP